MEASSALWPDVLDAFDVSERTFGLTSGLSLALAFPILLYGDRLTYRISKSTLLILGLGLLALAAVGLGLSIGPILVFVGLMVVRGVGIALVDLTGNALAIDAERLSGKHLMGPLHGGFSGGVIVATLLAAGVLGLGIAFNWVYAAVAAVLIGGIVLALPLTRLDLGDRPQTRPAFGSLADLRHPIVGKAALIVGIAFAGEVTLVEWSALYLTDVRGASGSVAAIALAAFSLAMLLGRTGNGLLLRKTGVRVSLILQGVTAAIGGVLLLLEGPIGIAILGCFIAGLGLAGAGPTALSVSGLAMPDRAAAAAGIALAGGYLGLIVSPIMGGSTGGRVQHACDDGYRCVVRTRTADRPRSACPPRLLTHR